jgi:DNA mismatch endonuclease, patch repair protein
MPKLQSFKKLERRLVRDGLPRTTPKTSARMARVRRAGTAPEIQVRRYLSSLGIRYRTRNRDLPGAPDLANRSKRWAVFVHGCFWHQHEQCKAATIPKTNQSFWRAKFTANRKRDARACQLLENMGYSVKIIWECQTRGLATIGKAVGRLPRASKAKRRSRSHS